MQIRYRLLLLPLLFLYTQSAWPQVKCDKSDWRCHDNYDFSLGYIFVHQFYKSEPIRMPISGAPDLVYSPKEAFPNDLSGYRLGFGSSLGQDSPFGFQFYYNQAFPKSKVYNNFQFTGKGKVFLGLINYDLNPKSRLKVSLVGGAGIFSQYLSITSLHPNLPFSQTTDSVDLDPVLGGNIKYQINSKFDIKFITFYDFAIYNKELRGRLVPSIMFGYHPS